MVLRTTFRPAAFLATMAAFAVPSEAGFTGSFALSTASVNANTASLTTATSYAFSGSPLIVDNFFAQGGGKNGFAGPVKAGDQFESTAFDTRMSSYSFAGADGTFRETAASIVLSTTRDPGGDVIGIQYYLLGTFEGGAVGGTPLPASFTLGFTQDGDDGNAISFSGTLVIPPASHVPESASVALLGLGLVAAFGLRRWVAL